MKPEIPKMPSKNSLNLRVITKKENARNKNKAMR